MRLNMPVTDVEYVLHDHSSIVSTTDLKGKITYANPYFIEVSGFEASELIGAPQNILRHPDMPVEAYADLWRTIKKGRPWSAMVKNRRKDGGFYWVMANVTSVMENGKPVGYMSVRTKPSREEVAAADALYKRVREGNPDGIAFAQGRVVRAGWRGRLAALGRLSLTQRVALHAVLLLGLLGTALAQLLVSGAKSQGTLVVEGLLVGAMMLTALLWRSVVRDVVAPLHQAMVASQTMAGGDLTQDIPVDREDDMGQLLRALRQLRINLRSIVGDVRSNSDQIGVATREIAAGNMDLSGRTESQASALEQTASSMEELASTVQNNSANANQANGMADEASKVAQQGCDIVSKVVTTMTEITQSSRQVAEITSIIEGIAFQTNILALNAAVEAARAGEQGRGFAVVASEVRSLAQRSAGAAKETKQLIDASVTRVDSGKKLAEDAQSTMEDIIRAVAQVSGIMRDIALASREQSTGISQVNDAVVQMDEVTQQNAALVEQAAAAASSLHEQTRHVQQALHVFKLNTGEGGGGLLAAADLEVPAGAPMAVRATAGGRVSGPVFRRSGTAPGASRAVARAISIGR